MGSNIGQVKQQVNQIGAQAKAVSGQLTQLANGLSKNISIVDAAIGGTAGGEDKRIISSIQAAINDLKEAAAAMQEASQAAAQWVGRA